LPQIDIWPPAILEQPHSWRRREIAPVPCVYIVAEDDNILPPPWQHRLADRLQARTMPSIPATR
jgi:hypothetical protein